MVAVFERVNRPGDWDLDPGGLRRRRLRADAAQAPAEIDEHEEDHKLGWCAGNGVDVDVDVGSARVQAQASAGEGLDMGQMPNGPERAPNELNRRVMGNRTHVSTLLAVLC